MNKAKIALTAFKAVRNTVRAEGQVTLSRDDNLFYDECDDVIIAALEKAIPAKPICGNDDQDCITCPRCGHELDPVDAGGYLSKDEHCSGCGQALDWSDF